MIHEDSSPTMRARAAVQDGKGNFSIEDIDVGDPSAGEVRVRIMASGVCHTDLKGVRVWPSALVMGHEGAGVVIDTGDGVTDIAPGDRVMLNWAMPCGNCFNCRAGLRNLCENKPPVPGGRSGGRGQPLGASCGLGTMSSVTVVPRSAITNLDVQIPFTSACTMGCCVMTGYGSVVNVAHVEPGSSVVVLGTGAVGICVVQAARIAGAAVIVAVDVKPRKLEYARSFGATHAILADPSDEELLGAAGEVKKLLG